jgi:uncharacterized protein YbaR (Trm112 family)
MHANPYSDLLVCPQTRKPLRMATEQELHALKQREGMEKVEGAWIRSDRVVAYPVMRGIPLLTEANAISLSATRRKPKTDETPENP